MAGHLSHFNLVVGPHSPRVPHSSVVRASNRQLKVMGLTPVGEDSEFFLSIRLESVLSFFLFTSKSPFHLSCPVVLHRTI